MISLSILILDIMIVGFGTYGAYVLIREFINLEHLLPLSQYILIIRKRWLPSLALLAALVLFFYRLFIGLFKGV